MNLGIAADLWTRGYNTKQIATAMNVREHVVYNDLTLIRYIESINDNLEKAQ